MNPYKKKLITQNLLKKVSRSFYLTLRFLPQAIRYPLSLAYLLARSTDTIADTAEVPILNRVELLMQLKNKLINQEPIENTQWYDFINYQRNEAEKDLLLHMEDILELFSELETFDQQTTIEVLKTIISGQTWDLQFFDNEEELTIVNSEEQLENYIYSVAGCVGEYWTKICQHHLKRYSTQEPQQLGMQAIEFGKGLQLTNILRDIADDFKLNRCYLPVKKQEDFKLSSFDNEKETLEKWRQKALRYLHAGFLSTQNIQIKRVQWACYLPILIGIKTLNKLEGFEYIAKMKKVKISRLEVYKIALLSYFLCSKYSFAEKIVQKWF